MNKVVFTSLTLAAAGLTIAAACGANSKSVDLIPATPGTGTSAAPLTGKAAFGDYTTDAPGTRRRITAADLPAPFATTSTDNGPQGTARPEGALPKVPEGFTASLFANNLDNPRKIITAPNGDIFVASSNPGQIQVLRDSDGDGKPEVNQTFATGLNKPFGLAFYPAGANPQWLYVGNTDSIVRIPYRSGDLSTSAKPELITDNISGGGQLRGGGHWTRDVAFSNDGKKMYVSVGSFTNVNQEKLGIEAERALIWEFTPDGEDRRIFAAGIRNPVGLAVDPRTGTLWTSVNERDGLGDDLVPDYITSVKDGGFYGWPWYYMGKNEDPRKAGERPDLRDKVLVPDVLLQPHYASLCLTFYNANAFPKEYQGGIFAAQHGSWNRAKRTGYKVVFVPVDGKGKAKGEFVDFATGMVADDKNVWGRPVGVTVARDGALLFSDDSSGSIWRVAYTGKRR
jgi:glucose/arabinose dehydrogenase